MNGEKRCPFCGGDVPADALKCRHCGEFLDRPGQRPQGGPPPYQQGMRSSAPPSNGSATAALVLGIIGLFGGCLAPVAIILSIIGLSNSKKHPSRPGFGTAVAGLILGLVGILIGVLFVVAVVMGFNIVSNEYQAIMSLNVIKSAEDTHKSKYSSYATMEQLALKKLISAELANATTPETALNGFYYQLQATYAKWSCTVIPVEPGVSGVNSYHIDQTGTVRFKQMTNKYDSPADANSPIMSQPTRIQPPVRQNQGG